MLRPVRSDWTDERRILEDSSVDTRIVADGMNIPASTVICNLVCGTISREVVVVELGGIGSTDPINARIAQPCTNRPQRMRHTSRAVQTLAGQHFHGCGLDRAKEDGKGS